MDFIPALVFLMIRESLPSVFHCEVDIVQDSCGGWQVGSDAATELADPAKRRSGNAKPRELSLMLWNESATVLSRLRPGD